MKTYQHYINGALCDPASGEWFDSENPYTGDVWAKIARGNADDIDHAVTAAKAQDPLPHNQTPVFAPDPLL